MQGVTKVSRRSLLYLQKRAHSSSYYSAVGDIIRNSCEEKSGHEWSSSRIRNVFLDFFADRGYTFVPSSPVVPFEEPSLFFVNAGMNQFKQIFLGTVNPSSKRAKLRTAVSSQKCIRAGGKHNDLADVGEDGIHHTFFEMLGNWSFCGHLSKAAVCKQAWELLTEVYRIPKQRLLVTYFEGDKDLGLPADLEALKIWTDVGVDVIGGGSDNFWQMDDAGPCGACTEILYSTSDQPSTQSALELWNIVFIEYNRLLNGDIKPLPYSHIDTGLGLERLTRIIQGGNSNYETDLFQPLLSAIHSGVGGAPYEDSYGSLDTGGRNAAFRTLADHCRMFTVAIGDGVTPDSRHAGHVLKKVLRNAAYKAVTLANRNDVSGLLPELSRRVASMLGNVYPELECNLPFILDVVANEEKKFFRTLAKAKAQFTLTAKDRGGLLTSDDLFLFYNTYGMTKEVLRDFANTKGIVIDEPGFQRALDRHKAHSGHYGHRDIRREQLANLALELREMRIPQTNDEAKYQYERGPNGDYSVPICEAKIIGLIVDGRLTKTVPVEGKSDILLDRTPFYAESGGQASDRGRIRWGSSVFEVEYVNSSCGYVFHSGKFTLSGSLAVGDVVQPVVNNEVRLGCMVHHTSTHLLLEALEQVLETSVLQRSSNFDEKIGKLSVWTTKTVSSSILVETEKLVNHMILSKLAVIDRQVPLDSAYKIPKVRFTHGEYYPDPVRIVSINVPGMASAAAEFCGGTHVRNGGDIGLFRIIDFENKGSNVTEITFAAGSAGKRAQYLAEKFNKEFLTLHNRANTKDRVEFRKKVVKELCTNSIDSTT